MKVITWITLTVITIMVFGCGEIEYSNSLTKKSHDPPKIYLVTCTGADK